jgi:hypothetical protein
VSSIGVDMPALKQDARAAGVRNPGSKQPPDEQPVNPVCLGGRAGWLSRSVGPMKLPVRQRFRPLPALSALVGLVLAVSACTTAVATSSAPAPSQRAQSPGRQPQLTPAASRAPIIGPSPCRPDQITAVSADTWYTPRVRGDFDSATDITLTNSSTTACTFGGWADVKIIGNTTELMCNPDLTPEPSCGPIHTANPRAQTETRISATATTFAVAPGQYEKFSILWYNALLNGSDCLDGIDAAVPWRVEIRLPGSSEPIVLTGGAVPMYPCSGKLWITPIGTTGGSL